MPRIKITIKERAAAYKSDKFYVSSSNILMCGICNLRLDSDKKDTLDKHVLTSSHLAKKASTAQDPQSSNKRQTTLFEANENAKKAKTEKHDFIHDTLSMCLKANIPVHKLDHPAVRDYLSKYVKGSGDLPSGDRLRREYVPKCGDEEKEKVKNDFANQHITLVCDETSDSRGRCVYAVVFKAAIPTDTVNVALASCSFLEKANGTTCSQAVMDTIQKYEIKYEHIDGLVSDSARYMGTCFNALQVLIGDHITHFTCWAHKINLLGDVFMKELPELNLLVSKMKIVFLHGRQIKNAYITFLKETFPLLPAVLFPNPVITRWNSWFKSVKYLGKYLEPLVQFLDQYHERNASADAVCDMFADASLGLLLRTQAKFVAEICQPLMDLINTLEGSKYPYAHLVWDKLQSINESLKRFANGAFPVQTTQFLANQTNANKRAVVTASLTSACQKALNKLALHMRPSQANNLYSAAGALFNPAIAGQKFQVDEQGTLALKAKLPAFRDVSADCFVDGYLYFHRQLLDRLRENPEDICDVKQICLAICQEKAEFGNAALQTIWAPVSSVDAERFFSQYNLVVTDRRNRLKEENVETCSMLMFN